MPHPGRGSAETGNSKQRKPVEGSRLPSAKQFEPVGSIPLIFGLFTGQFETATRRFSVLAAFFYRRADYLGK
jgi:hypothetical protein